MPDVIMENLERFLNQWGDECVLVLNQAAHKKIEKSKDYIKRGCLSGIPVGCFKKKRMDVQLAIASLGTFFYNWNKKRSTGQLNL